MIHIALSRAGFTAACVSSAAQAAVLNASFDVIVREAASPDELSATPVDVRLRTVVITTKPRWSSTGGVFAAVVKPFDLDALLQVVAECALNNGSRRDNAPTVEACLTRFAASVPALRSALARQATSARELLLRAEIRNALFQISSVLHEASEVEHNQKRALGLRATAIAAADLADVDRPVSSISAERRH